MEKSKRVYLELQRHLNHQPVGFPATRSGAEIKILEHIFTPLEAKIATFLSYKPQPLEKIFDKARNTVESLEKLEQLLMNLGKKGGLEITFENGEKSYSNAPYVVGMYEFQVNRMTSEFIRHSRDYTSDLKFGLEILSTKLPQMRTIPIAKSIRPEHHISTFDEVAALLKEAAPPFVVLECICRKKSALEGHPCQVTDLDETCLAIGSVAQFVLGNGIGRNISLDEARSILEQNQKKGLVLQPSNTQKAEFICSCCGCCCGILNMHKKLPKPLDFWASNYLAVIDADRCNGCGNCLKRCQVGAIDTPGRTGNALVNLNRCLGCGVCVPVCPNDAISLRKKDSEITPPKNRRELYDIIMAHKKGSFGKIGLAGKLVIDAIRTGQTHLFRSRS